MKTKKSISHPAFSGFNLTVSILSIIMLLLISCDPNLEEISTVQEVTFSFKSSGKSKANGRIAGVMAIENANHLIVSIKDNLGNSVFTQKELKLHRFNGEFLSQPISLVTGTFELYEFLVSDSLGNIIYITPKTGSHKAYLVEDPLTIEFSVAEESITKIVPEVISTSDSKAEDFGYANFQFNVVETFDFLIKVFVYNSLTNLLEPTVANLMVYHEKDTIYTNLLEETTNQITISDRYSDYKIVLSKPGFEIFEQNFTNTVLKSYFDSRGNGPLEVVLYPAGLILWNKLGSVGEVENSVFGSNGVFDNPEGQLTFGEGKFGNGVNYPFFPRDGTTICKITFDLSEIEFTTTRGTIEFWWRAGYEDNTLSGDNGFRYFFTTADGNSHPPNPIKTPGTGHISFINDNFQTSRPDINFWIGQHGFGEEDAKAQTSSSYKAFENGELMHWAISFDVDGIPNQNGKTIIIFKNGEEIASSTENWNPAPINNLWLGTMASTFFEGDTRQLGYGSAAGNYDNLKIWNHAKTEF